MRFSPASPASPVLRIREADGDQHDRKAWRARNSRWRSLGAKPHRDPREELGLALRDPGIDRRRDVPRQELVHLESRKAMLRSVVTTVVHCANRGQEVLARAVHDSNGLIEQPVQFHEQLVRSVRELWHQALLPIRLEPGATHAEFKRREEGAVYEPQYHRATDQTRATASACATRAPSGSPRVEPRRSSRASARTREARISTPSNEEEAAGPGRGPGRSVDDREPPEVIPAKSLDGLSSVGEHKRFVGLIRRTAERVLKDFSAALQCG